MTTKTTPYEGKKLNTIVLIISLLIGGGGLVSIVGPILTHNDTRETRLQERENIVSGKETVLIKEIQKMLLDTQKLNLQLQPALYLYTITYLACGR